VVSNALNELGMEMRIIDANEDTVKHSNDNYYDDYRR
jgi:hypothetical protein